MPKSKFFRVATSGATTDGRTINPQDLVDMAATYDPATYQARVNLEHIQSASPESAFGSYGDVLALKTEPVTLNVGGKAEQRTALYAQIEALDPLLDLQKRSQKLYTSIQVRPNFAKSGKAYLDGLAFTDNPASLGTEIMKFSATAGEASPFHFRKSSADTIITAAEEVTLEFADETSPIGLPGADPKGNAIMDALRRVFDGFSAERTAPVAPVVTDPAKPNPLADPAVIAAFAALRGVMELAVEGVTRIGGAQATLATDFAAAKAELASIKAENARLKEVLDKLPAAGFTPRHRSTGADKTDADLRTDV